MESNEPNKHYRGVHRPHQKMKFPLFGGGSGGDSPASRRARRRAEETGNEGGDAWGNDLFAKLLPLVLVAFIAYAVYDTFSGMGGARRNIVSNPGDIREQAWTNAKVTKKWAEITPKRTRLLLELRGADGQKQLLDLNDEKSKFWDRVDVRNHLTKPTGSLDVRVDTYGRDTTMVMKF